MLQNEHYANLKKPVTKGHTLYDSIYMEGPEQAKTQRQNVDEWVAGVGEEETRE